MRTFFADGHAMQQVTNGLSLAAAPVFALMGGVSASNAAAMPLCSAAAGILPLNGMAAMYLLMAVFHLSPWLKLASGRTQACI